MLRTTRIFTVEFEILEDAFEKGFQQGMRINKTFVADCLRVAFENAGKYLVEKKYGVPLRLVSIVDSGEAIIETH